MPGVVTHTPGMARRYHRSPWSVHWPRWRAACRAGLVRVVGVRVVGGRWAGAVRTVEGL